MSTTDPIITSAAVHYDFPTVWVEDFATTDRYGQAVQVRRFVQNGSLIEAMGSKIRKDGRPANTDQILTAVEIPANVRAALEGLA